MICSKKGTAGISEHPAEILDIPSGKSDSGPKPRLVAPGMHKDSSSASFSLPWTATKVPSEIVFLPRSLSVFAAHTQS